MHSSFVNARGTVDLGTCRDRAVLASEKARCQQVARSMTTMGAQSIARGRVREINRILREMDGVPAKPLSFEELVASSPVAAAVAPQKAAAQDYAEKEARANYDEARKTMEAADWNLDVVAPRPDSRKDGKVQYRAKAARRQFFGELFASDHSRNAAAQVEALKQGNFNARITFLKADEDKLARYIHSEREAAGLSFDAFVAKLVGKVGPVVKATYQGFLWSGSWVDVVKADGTKESWHTQQIINRSVLGKLFNQWPTRKRG